MPPIYVVVGEEPSTGDPAIQTSPDAGTWNDETVPGSLGAVAVVAGGPVFIAPLGTSGSTNNYLYSAGTSSWTIGSSGTTNSLNVGAYGNGRYVFVAGPNSVTSTTGLPGSFTVHAGAMTGTNWREVTFADGVFVAVGTTVEYSTDGITWTEITTMPFVPSTITYGAGLWVATRSGAAGQEGDARTDMTATSTNLTTWTGRNSFGGAWGQSAYANGRFLALGIGFNAGESPTTFTVRMLSTDGITWTFSRMQSEPLLSGTTSRQLVGGGGRFVWANAAQSPDSTISVSTNGSSWSTDTFTDRSWLGIAVYVPKPRGTRSLGMMMRGRR